MNSPSNVSPHHLKVNAPYEAVVGAPVFITKYVEYMPFTTNGDVIGREKDTVSPLPLYSSPIFKRGYYLILVSDMTNMKLGESEVKVKVTHRDEAFYKIKVGR